MSRLAAHQLSQREIARLTGISQAQVSKKLSLLTLPDAAKADMLRGDLTFTEALRLLELPDQLQAGVYEQGKQHGYTLDAAIRLTTARLDTEAKAAAARQRLADEGTRLVGDPADEFGPDQVTCTTSGTSTTSPPPRPPTSASPTSTPTAGSSTTPPPPGPGPGSHPHPAPATGPSPHRGQTTPTPPTTVTMPTQQKISPHTTRERPSGTTPSPRSSTAPTPNSPQRYSPSSPFSAGKTMKTKTSPPGCWAPTATRTGAPTEPSCCVR